MAKVQSTRLVKHSELDSLNELLAETHKLSFDIFEFSQKISQDKVLPALALDAFEKNQLGELICDKKAETFLYSINKTYRKQVQYHNALHGADVMQYANFMLIGCNLKKVINLSKLDVLSMLVAGLAHDLGHDGFTNAYH